MAARLRSDLAQRHREAIKVSMLLKRLQDHALAQNGVTMDRTQIRAAEILLRKALPDLVSTELSAAPGTMGGFVVFGQAEAPSVEAWSEANPPPS